MKHLRLILMALLLVVSAGIASAAGQPSCDFTASTISGPEDLSVTFTGDAYNMSAPFSYHWDFGDSTGAEVTSVTKVSDITHTYLNPGKYTVSLAVYDIGIPTTLWFKTEKTEYITVTNKSPIDISMNAVPNHGNAVLKVSFIGSATGAGIEYAWDFGDGNTGTGKNPTHWYTSKGIYNATLTATNDGGATSTSGIITVYPPEPVVDFTASSATVGAKPFAVAFEDKSTYDGALTGWSWNFGDGNMSTDQNPVHVYMFSGYYNVSLTVSSPSGNAMVKKERFVKVTDVPDACPTPEPTVDPIPVPTVDPTPVPTPVPNTDPVAYNSSNAGVFRPATGIWYLDNTNNGTVFSTFHYGTSGDVPLTGDFNGDGITDSAVFRSVTGTWYVDTNKDGVSDMVVHFGAAGDTPLAVDFNADGVSDFVIFRPVTANWYIDTNRDGVSDITFHFGASGDVPVAGNWN